MRKILLSVTIIVLIFAFTTTDLEARSSRGGGMNFYINAGAATTDGFDQFAWQTGAMLDIHLGEAFIISPEVMLFGDFGFDWLEMLPGATFNIKFGNPRASQLFLGAGALIYVPIEPSGGGGDLFLKAQGGFISDSIKLTIYAASPLDDISAGFVLGANIGFGLNL